MKLPLEPNKTYHIYNHANGFEKLFLTEDNFLFFLKKYAFYISPIADTFAYCLMTNHLHFAIRIKSEVQIMDKIKILKGKNVLIIQNNSKLIENFISKQFANLFSSYTQAFNKQQNRMGSLFMQNFKRKEIDNEDYCKQVIYYIHNNPVHHGYVSNLRDWKFSSFETYFSSQSTKLAREEVISWFGNKEVFLSFHQQKNGN